MLSKFRRSSIAEGLAEVSALGAAFVSSRCVTKSPKSSVSLGKISIENNKRNIQSAKYFPLNLLGFLLR